MKIADSTEPHNCRGILHQLQRLINLALHFETWIDLQGSQRLLRHVRTEGPQAEIKKLTSPRCNSANSEMGKDRKKC